MVIVHWSWLMVRLHSLSFRFHFTGKKKIALPAAIITWWLSITFHDKTSKIQYLRKFRLHSNNFTAYLSSVVVHVCELTSTQQISCFKLQHQKTNKQIYKTFKSYKNKQKTFRGTLSTYSIFFLMKPQACSTECVQGRRCAEISCLCVSHIFDVKPQWKSRKSFLQNYSSTGHAAHRHHAAKDSVLLLFILK